jgi:uncharacterized protein YkwD
VIAAPAVGEKSVRSTQRGVAAWMIGACLVLVFALGLPISWAEGDRASAANVEASIIAFANAARVRAGAPPLEHEEGLAAIAVAYAQDLSEQERLDHTGSDGSTIRDRADRGGFGGWTFLGENLVTGYGHPDAEAIIDAWLRSPDHRRNLLSADLRAAGASCVARRERYWCALELGASDISAPASADLEAASTTR